MKSNILAMAGQQPEINNLSGFRLDQSVSHHGQRGQLKVLRHRVIANIYQCRNQQGPSVDKNITQPTALDWLTKVSDASKQ